MQLYAIKSTSSSGQVVHRVGCCPHIKLRLLDKIHYIKNRLSTSVDSLFLECGGPIGECGWPITLSDQNVDGLMDRLSNFLFSRKMILRHDVLTCGKKKEICGSKRESIPQNEFIHSRKKDFWTLRAIKKPIW